MKKAPSAVMKKPSAVIKTGKAKAKAKAETKADTKPDTATKNQQHAKLTESNLNQHTKSLDAKIEQWKKKKDPMSEQLQLTTGEQKQLNSRFKWFLAVAYYYFLTCLL